MSVRVICLGCGVSSVARNDLRAFQTLPHEGHGHACEGMSLNEALRKGQIAIEGEPDPEPTWEAVTLPDGEVLMHRSDWPKCSFCGFPLCRPGGWGECPNCGSI